MSVNIYSELIDERLTMGDLVDTYLPLKHGRHGNRIPCPFHQGKDDNFSFNDRTYYCFVCGEKGNMITFVQKLFNLTFMQAITKLNVDFGLGLSLGKKLSYRERIEMQKRSEEAKKAREERLRQQQEKQETYWALYDEWKRLDDNYEKYKPTLETPTMHPLFLEALQNKDRVKYELDSFYERSDND